MLTFEQALKQSAEKRQRHVLLGNGFSRACRNDIFSYDALFERADFQHLSGNAKSLFEALETTDFEAVIEALRQSALIVPLYAAGSSEMPCEMERDADSLRDVLVSAIASSHPDRPSDIAPDAYAACKTFLDHFDKIFTLNYDLLLYWAVMQREIDPDVEANDGFWTPEYGEAEYVTWEIENRYNQNIYYLHGALHLFDAGAELQKYTWVNTGVRLTEQVRHALSDGKYPMFVAEGSSEDKVDRIKHHAYLTKAFESFSSIAGALFVFGHSLAESDEHILHLIEKGKVTELYVGIFGDPESATNQAIRERAENMRQFRFNLGARRRKKPPELNVWFYDAQSAAPWG